MRRLAVLSFHTSPLLQPGVGDAGGMNVYVRELTSALARQGIRCDVFTRRTASDQPNEVVVEPNLVVHHITAGPFREVPLEELEAYVEAFGDGVLAQMTTPGGLPLDDGAGGRYDAIHANYWLSALAGHRLKHALEIPLVSTFHTLDRVKAETDPDRGGWPLLTRRAAAEAAVIGCSDAILASCDVEAEQIVDLYGADPGRICCIAPGIEHAFFGPGDQAMARRAIGLDTDDLLAVFVGRIQPLKRADLAAATVAELRRRGWPIRLVVVGGPSGPHGADALQALEREARRTGISPFIHRFAPQPHHLLSSFYRAADVVLVPSRSESFGLVALEAGACGVPVVASKVGGLTTLVDDGLTGALVDEADPVRWADAVESIAGGGLHRDEVAHAAVLRAAPYTWRRAGEAFRQRLEVLVASNLVQC